MGVEEVTGRQGGRHQLVFDVTAGASAKKSQRLTKSSSKEKGEGRSTAGHDVQCSFRRVFDVKSVVTDEGAVRTLMTARRTTRRSAAAAEMTEWRRAHMPSLR